MMHKARRAGKASFVYKGNTYTRSKTKTGLVVYRKGGAKGGSVRSGGKRKGGSVRSGGSMVSGGAMTAQGRQVQKIGKKLTTTARRATNTVVNQGPKAMEFAANVKSALSGGRIGRRRKRRAY